MLCKPLSLLAVAGTALAQNVPTLLQALNSSSDLSSLNAVLQTNPDLVKALGSASNITILAPSNKAFSAVPNATLQGLVSNQAAITGLLQYHVLNGTYRAEQITSTPAFVPTLLTDPKFTNVTGGQRVEAVARNGGVTFYSGLLANSTVSQANVNFTGGVIHVIDSILTLPAVASETLLAANLTSLRGAVISSNLTEAVNYTPNLTIFAPNNEAFRAIGSGLGSLSAEQIVDVLGYHIINGTVAYSSTLKNDTVVPAANGKNLTITINDGRIFVNDARVVIPNVLIANGVVHVIDAVLNPSNATIAKPNAQQGSPAFAGATPVANAPFTSGQPQPTNVLSPPPPAGSPSPSGSSVSVAAAAPMQTGAVGMGALLGAAAVYFL